MKAVNDSDFSALLATDKPVVVDFWAPWCQPCRILGPVIEEIAEEFADKAVVAKCNVDENMDIPSQLGIRSIPAVYFFKNGQAVDLSVGLVPKEVLTEKLVKLL